MRPDASHLHLRHPEASRFLQRREGSGVERHRTLHEQYGADPQCDTATVPRCSLRNKYRNSGGASNVVIAVMKTTIA
jgi:hypothetical protein